MRKWFNNFCIVLLVLGVAGACTAAGWVVVLVGIFVKDQFGIVAAIATCAVLFAAVGATLATFGD